MRSWLLILWCAPLLAVGGPAMEDFAVAFPVLPEGEGRIVEVELDARVYRAATTSTLDDLRVFDGEGRPVAHVILERAAVEPAAAIEVPVFALPPVAEAGSTHRIEVAESGAVIAVLGAERTGTPAAGPRRWLLDLSAVDDAVDAVHFTWTLPAQQTMLAAATLEASNDLDRWRRITARGTLADLMQEGSRLRRDRLQLPPTSARYLRLTLDEGANLDITAAHVRPAPAVSGGEWLRIEASSGTGRDGRWVYDLGGPLPVDAVRLAPDSGTQFFPVRVGWGDSELADVSSSVSGVLHSMAAPDASAASAPLQLRVREARWLLLHPGTGAPAQPLPVEVLVKPAQLRFVAAGVAPWQIAVGRFGLAAPTDDAARTLATLGQDDPQANRVPKAGLGDHVTLAGDAARRPGPSGDSVFWLAIIGGVLLLSLMLWRVIADMRGSNASS
ncbi:MAG: DUF3999 family protein [Gammaproteobacteria bacterium]|nr:DUF3999 family protein [Gammaproteobacteria bacterium]